jgi:sarcosine oxidase
MASGGRLRVSRSRTAKSVGTSPSVKIAVVGAGIVGSCAAFELASAGQQVTLFEQFDIDHDRGSSFGDSRIIRRFYDDPYYTKLMSAAFEHWRRLEAVSGESLYEVFGGLYFGPAGHESIASGVRGMRSVGADAKVLDAKALRARFPAFRFREDEAGFVDDLAGSLRASRCVRAAVSAARRAGATVISSARVERIESHASGGVDVIDRGGERSRFDRALACAGPWSRALLAHMDLPLRVTRQQYVHLRPTSDAAAFDAGAMPIWIDAGENWYGFPRHGDVEGVKIATHDFGDVVDPDDVDRAIDETLVARTREYASRRLPALAGGDVVFAKTCLYTVSPDEDFMVDAVRDVPGYYFVSGCSGHMFKFGALLGAVAADLASDREPRADISRFRMERLHAV